MPKQEGQKSKLVTLLRILEQRTDENHRLNVPQLVQLLENQAERVALCAPTGRAAKVLSLYAGKPARTIHKCIYSQNRIDLDTSEEHVKRVDELEGGWLAVIAVD